MEEEGLLLNRVCLVSMFVSLSTCSSLRVHARVCVFERSKEAKLILWVEVALEYFGRII